MIKEGKNRPACGGHPALPEGSWIVEDRLQRPEEGGRPWPSAPSSVLPEFWCPANPFVPCGISGNTSHNLILSLFVTAWVHYKG